MKILSATLRLSSGKAFLLFITIAVCSALPETEVNPKSAKENPSQGNFEASLGKSPPLEDNPSVHKQASNIVQTQFSQPENLNQFNRNIKRNPALDNLKKSQSDYSEESSEFDGEKESDGYGYDDDDYYHVNNKRNDAENKNGDRNNESEEKLNREDGTENGISDGNKNNNNCCRDQKKESQTIECLNFKESHIPPSGSGGTVQLPKANLQTNEMKPKQSSTPLDSFRVRDLKGNSAVDEKAKDGKKEISSSKSSNPKVNDPQKATKLSGEKDSLKSKGTKLSEEGEKKDKNSGLKGEKENVATKNTKDTAKNAEGKEKIDHNLKNIKLSVSAKLENDEENLKNKETQTVRLDKENKESFKPNDKVKSDSSNLNKISKINIRANFVSNDYKDNLEQGKNSGVEEREKKSKATNKEVESVEVKGNEGNPEIRDRSKSFALSNTEDNSAALAPELNKGYYYLPFPSDSGLESKNSRESFKKRESKKERSRIQEKEDVENVKKNVYRFKIPQNEIENTEYHKNFIKSLRKYKALGDQKMLNAVSAVHKTISEKNLHDFSNEEELKKNKRFKSVKRRLTEVKEPVKENLKNSHSSNKRNVKSDFAKKPQRERRDSPKKLEYEIKIINEKPAESKNTPLTKLKQNRKKKNTEMIKELPNYTHSRTSPNYFARLGSSKNEDKKMKRTLPAKRQQKRRVSDSEGEKTHVKVRGAPSGYYSNRVKFGQKHFAPAYETQPGDSYLFDTNQFYFDNPPLAPRLDSNRPLAPYENYIIPQYYDKYPVPSQYPSRFQSLLENGQKTLSSGKNFLQTSWETQNEYNKHVPIKRYDEASSIKQLEPNSLFLMKKDHNGEHIAKTFIEATNKKDSSENLSAEQIAKILAKDNDYVVLKKTDQNQYQKVMEGDLLPINIDYDTLSLGKKKLDLVDVEKLHPSKSSSKASLLNSRDIFTRSYQTDDNKKYTGQLQSIGPKIDFEKNIDRIKDVANFFKDSKQKLLQNQNVESKEGSDIVFSEDKLPDPVVVNNEGKSGVLKPKAPQNSIFSISSNFKTLDQKKNEGTKDYEAGKDTSTSDNKLDNNVESTWMNLLKNAFPEAKTVTRNGNEVLVLGFDHTGVKAEDKNRYMPLKGPKQSPPGPGCESSSAIAGEKQVKILLNDDLTQSQGWRLLSEDTKKHPKTTEGTLELDAPSGSLVISGGDCQIQIPLNQLAYFSQMFKNLNDKKPTTIAEPIKILRKKNANWFADHEMSPKYNNFVKDLRELSKIDNEYTNNEMNQFEKNANSYSPSTGNDSPEYNKYSDANNGNYENAAQNSMANDNTAVEGSKPTYDINDPMQYQKSDNDFQNSNYWQSDSNPSPNTDNRWTTVEDNFKKPLRDDVYKVPNEMQEEINNLLHGEGLKGSAKNNYQNELWHELSAASDKIQRLRREGVGKRKLRKTIEEALAFRGRRQSEKNNNSPLNTGQNQKTSTNTNSGSNEVKAESDETVKDDSYLKDKSDKNSISKVKSSLKQKRDCDFQQTLRHFKPENSVKDSLEGSRLVKNKMNEIMKSKENGVRKRKKRHTYRRSPNSSFRSKVSTPEVQNKILKNLREDIYESVSSPGMRRKLLSIEAEEEDYEKHLNEEVADERQRQPDCVRNAMSKCIDPLILELFEDDAKPKKARARRNAFHSSYKREIDLDESMPNDFQNFLVTSLGGFEGQKREVVKKDEAFLEGKEGSQDSLNQIVESFPVGKDSEDSLLEKREVSMNKKTKQDTLKDSSEYYVPGRDSGTSSLADVMEVINRPLKKSRIQNSNPEKAFSDDYGEDKTPTQIRIQITNGSTKEKKSSKSVMDENDNNSNDEQPDSKDTDFLDKSKLKSPRLKSPQNFLQAPKSVYSYSFESRNGDPFTRVNNRNLYFGPHAHITRRKKKKYAQDSLSKATKDVSAFDQKSMETLLKKCFKEQPLGGMSGATTQRAPVANHLPQVETVYNPTQGTNKAQLQSYHMPGKQGHINAKANVNQKNLLHSNELSTLDDNFLRSTVGFLKDKSGKPKGDKNAEKEFEGADLKQNYKKLKFHQDQSHLPPAYLNEMKNLPDMATSGHSPNNPNARLFNLLTQPKWYQLPYPSYFYQNPTSNILTTNSLYDNLKFKQDFQPYGGFMRDRVTSKGWSPYAYVGDNFLHRQDGKIRTQSSYDTIPGENTWNTYDYYFNKKPAVQKYGADYKSQMQNRNKMGHRLNSYSYAKPPVDERQNIFNSQPVDYVSPDDEDYIDDYPNQQDLQSDDSVIEALTLKKPAKTQLTPMMNRGYTYKNANANNSPGEEDDDMGEDYDENVDEEELDDYTLLSSPNAGNPELSKTAHVNEKFVQGAIHPKPNAIRPNLQGNNLQRSELKTKKNEKLFHDGEAAPLNENKPSADTLDGSLATLKKANEKSNIFGKNLFKNLNQYGYDEHAKERDKLQKINSLRNYRELENMKKSQKKLSQMKYRRQNKIKRMPNSSRRFFYISKIETFDANKLRPFANGRPKEIKYRNTQNNYYRLPKRNPLNAELRGAENDFEYESEENINHFNGNLINNGKISFPQKKSFASEDKRQSQKQKRGTNKRDNEDEKSSESVEDVKENLEDDGETISEDNVLENVIGKYIMRKSIKPSADSKLKQNDDASYSVGSPEGSNNHKTKKRSIHTQTFPDVASDVKIVRKRLSSGHLTENNYRKYHKKNLRRVDDGDVKDKFFEGVNTDLDELRNSKGKAVKRSALDIFRKLTKEKDKKMNQFDPRTAGFEPLLSSNENKLNKNVKEEQKFDSGKSNSRDTEISHPAFEKEKSATIQIIKNSVLEDTKKFEGDLNKNTLEFAEEQEKSKLKDELMENSLPKVESGPWKVELNEKIEESPPNQNVVRVQVPVIDEDTSFVKENEPESAKTYLVVPKTVTAMISNINDDSRVHRVEGPEIKIGNSFWHSLEVNPKHMWKRYSALPEGWQEKSQEKGRRENAVVVRNPLIRVKESNENKQTLPGTQPNLHDSDLETEDRESRYSDESIPSKGRFNNRKSVYPLPSDANIIKDSSQLNDETSKYLGQQIVGAIYSHVSSQPKFKELIAPGLATRKPCYKDDSEGKKRALHQEEFTEQVQSILQRVMFDIEKVAEKHVKRRMCNKIDKESKVFLHSLIKLPTDKDEQKLCPDENLCLNYNQCSPVDPPINLVLSSPAKSLSSMYNSQPKHNAHLHYRDKQFENLMKKQRILSELVDSYESLSNLEKQNLDINFMNFKHELDQTNKLIRNYKVSNRYLDNVNMGTPNTNYNKNNTVLLDSGFEMVQSNRKSVSPPKAITQTKTVFKDPQDPTYYVTNPAKAPSFDDKQMYPTQANLDYSAPSIPKTSQSEPEATSKMTASVEDSATTKPQTTSAQQSSSVTEPAKTTTTISTEIKPSSTQSNFDSPERFDLLPMESAVEALDTINAIKRVRSKQVSRDTNKGSKCIFKFHSNYQTTTPEPVFHNELHKLGYGDAANIQKWSKHKGPWVSNLDTKKSPTCNFEFQTYEQPRNTHTKPKHLTSKNSPLFYFKNNIGHFVTSDDVRRPDVIKSLDYTAVPGYYYQKPILPFRLDKKFYIRKDKPFHSVYKNDDENQIQILPMQYFLRKFRLPEPNTNTIPPNYKMCRPRTRSKRSIRRERLAFRKSHDWKPATLGTGQTVPEEKYEPEEDDPDMEYLVWSSMPAIRRRLNNMEINFNSDFYLPHSNILLQSQEIKNKNNY